MKTIVVGELQTNCYIVWHHSSPEALVVDAGGEPERIAGEIRSLGLQPQVMFATHGHVDHIAGACGLKSAFPHMRFAAMDRERELFSRPTLNLSFFLGWRGSIPEPDTFLKDGEELEVGPMRFRAVELPGHTQGSGALIGELDGSRVVFCGDTLFAGGVGRTDLPGGDEEALFRSIREKLFSLDDAAQVYPGHGPDTTIGQERGSNPFLSY